MLTLQELRQKRGQITEIELWQRCKSAARLEMRGQTFSTDDRDECAAKIMAQGLEETKGSLPVSDSPKHTLSAYCGRAKNHRRSLEAQRQRDEHQAMMELDQSAWADIEIDVYEPEEISAEDAMRIAKQTCKRLGMSYTSSSIGALFYGYVRDLPSQDVAAELGMNVAAYDMACSRGRSLVRAAFPNAGDFLDALAGGSTHWTDPMTQTAILRFVLQDDSSEAKHGPSRLLVRPWRDWQSVEFAMSTRFDLSVVSKAAKRVLSLEAQSESLRNLGMALQRV